MVAQQQQAPPSASQIRQEVQSAVQQAVQAAQQARVNAQQAGQAVQGPQAPTAPVALPPVPNGGGRVIIDRQGDRTVITSASLPPDVMPLAQMAQETALGLMGLIAAMVILGPFARMLARRFDRRTEIKSAGEHSHVLQQQILQLQQSVDAMSLEVERISEAQRFQTKLLNEGRGPNG
jgi:regulator of protease activity HflC (stomatin/prohibitin superfamily)